MLDEHHGWPGVIESISFGWNSKERERLSRISFFSPLSPWHGLICQPKGGVSRDGSPHLILIKKLDSRWGVFYKRENLLGLWFCRPRSGGQSVNKGLD